MDFPYLEVEKGIFAPIVSLKILGKHKKWIDSEAYVDSGATYCIFNEEIIRILGVELERGKKIFVTVGDGGLIPVFLHQFAVQFSGFEFKATIGFSKKLGVEFNLLGRHSFFDRFMICFNDKHKFLRTTLL